MIDPKDNQETSFIHRKTEHQPRKDFGHLLFGRYLATADAPHQTIGKAVGLAVFASDALSSSAYAIDEILIVLILAGSGALSISLPIAISIIALLVILTISYEQTIHTYPGGGGAYIVARDNLGEIPALVAGASLLVDYILTVAVSISSGVAQITSAFPELYDFRVVIALALVAFMTVVNLRGVKESGQAFAIPTYVFLGMTLLTIGVGFFRYFTGTLGTVPPESVEVAHAGEPLRVITLFLILRAFSGGCTALTGVEAISNGIMAFKEPRSRNAGLTLMWMSGILAINLLGLTFLAHQVGVLPSHFETGFSQIGRVVYNLGSPLYLALLGSTTLILIMAANTSYADFPRLAALVAGDAFLPRQLQFRGRRLAFSNGITALAGIASILIVVFRAETNALIPLYAIGVYLSFTLSQSGMAIRWLRSGHLRLGETFQRHGMPLYFDPKWKMKMFLNGLGAVATAIVMLVFSITKFREGAWVVLLLIPSLMGLFMLIHRHYRTVASSLSLENYGEPPPYMARHRVIVPMSAVHQGTLAALRYARMLSDDVTAVHVSMDPAETEKVHRRWERWGRGTRLVILDSPYRLFLEPLLGYINEILSTRQPNETITIVVPQFIAGKKVYKALHMQTAEMLRRELLATPGVVITEVPYQIP
ncbi:MAG TPA: APC family permease [Anaerolineales bacterium]|nr:APC family permease [Anaerolineales bacterium]